MSETTLGLVAAYIERPREILRLIDSVLEDVLEVGDLAGPYTRGLLDSYCGVGDERDRLHARFLFMSGNRQLYGCNHVAFDCGVPTRKLVIFCEDTDTAGVLAWSFTVSVYIHPFRKKSLAGNLRRGRHTRTVRGHWRHTTVSMDTLQLAQHVYNGHGLAGVLALVLVAESTQSGEL